MGEDPNVVAARDQLQREANARQQFARGCGIALIELTAVLEGEDVRVDPNVDPLGVVLLAFAARGRRLLRAAYRLLDAGDRAEAVPLLRILTEYLIVATWLKKNQGRLGDWAIRDHDRRDLVIRRVIAHMENEPELKQSLNDQRVALDERRSEWVLKFGEPARGMPKVDQMAADVGMGFGYDLAYRVQSQSDVHPTPLAVDSSFERLPDGTLRLLAAPVHGLWNWDQYAIGVHLLRDLLAVVSDHLPTLMWRTGLEGITDALNASRASDPHKHADPESVLRAAGLQSVSAEADQDDAAKPEGVD